MMRLLWLGLIALRVFLAGAQQPPPSGTASPPIPEQDGVLVLSESSFATAARTFDPLFVLFDSSARHDSTAGTNPRFASFDVSQLTHTVPMELKVLGLPALLLFHCLSAWPVSNDQNSMNVTLFKCAEKQGGVEVYTGGRSSMEFQRFALGQPLRERIQVSTRRRLDAIVKTRPFVALFVVDGNDSQAFIDCRVLAQIDSDTSVYVVTTNGSILTEANSRTSGSNSAQVLRQIPALVLFREFGRERVVYEDGWNKPGLLQFIQKNRYNLISTYTESDASFFYDQSAVAHVLLFSDPSAPHHPDFISKTQDVALYYYSARNNPGGYVLRFLVITNDQVTLKNALFVLDDQFPTVLVVRNVSQAPTRMPFAGDKTIELIQNGAIGHAISDELERIFPPYTTADLPDEEDPSEELVDWRDYSDLFENRQVPFLVRLPVLVQDPDPSPPTIFASQTAVERRLTELDTGAPSLSTDFLSTFASSKSSSSATSPNIFVEVLDFDQLQSLLAQHERNELHHRHRQYVLLVLHSPRCYSCRQAMDALRAIPPGSGVDTLAIVNVDRVDVREWPFRFQSLPGIFLLSGRDQVAMFPSRTAVTVDALQDFVDRSTVGPVHTTSHIS